MQPNRAASPDAASRERARLRSRIYAGIVAMSAAGVALAWWGRTHTGQLTNGDSARFPLVLVALGATFVWLLAVPAAEAWFGVASFAAFGGLMLVKQAQLLAAGGIDDATRLVQLLDLWPWFSVLGLLPFVGLERRRATLASLAYLAGIAVVSAVGSWWRPFIDPTLLARLVLANACSVALVATAVHLNERTARAEAQADAMRELALLDVLTGIANRRALDEHLAIEVAHSGRTGARTSVILVDLDHFKVINDRYGHETGDQALVDTAAILVAGVRATDTAGRWGGEEFAIVLRATDMWGARDLAERIRVTLERSVKGGQAPLTASFGVAQWTPGTTATDLMKRADEALYAAKAGGRNTVRVAPLDGAPPAAPSASLSPTSLSA